VKITSTEGLDFANYNNLRYFELNPWESSMEEISAPFDWMASLCVRKMNSSLASSSVPIYQKKFIFHGYHYGWWVDVHRFYHPSFRSFVFLVMLSCTRGKNKQDTSFNASILPLEVKSPKLSLSSSSLSIDLVLYFYVLPSCYLATI
jgi:hypothetical protein